MREFKIILGLILIAVSLFTFGTTYEQYRGEEIYGALTVFILLIIIGGGLIYSTQHTKIQEEKRKEKAYFKERAIINEISKKEENLINLRDKGILSEEEFSSKSSQLHADRVKTEVEKTEEYRQLNYLYESNILSKQEFDSKVELLIDKYKTTTNHTDSKHEISNNGLQKLGDFKEGMARIWDEDQQYGFIDEKNMIVIPPKYDLAEDFNEGLAMVMGYGNYGFINKKGDVVIHLQYDDAKSFENGVTKVRLGKEEFYIDKTGREVVISDFNENSEIKGQIKSKKYSKTKFDCKLPLKTNCLKV